MLDIQSWVSLFVIILVPLAALGYVGFRCGLWQRLYRVYVSSKRQDAISRAVRQREREWQQRLRITDADESEVEFQRMLEAQLRAVDQAYESLIGKKEKDQ